MLEALRKQEEYCKYFFYDFQETLDCMRKLIDLYEPPIYGNYFMSLMTKEQIVEMEESMNCIDLCLLGYIYISPHGKSDKCKDIKKGNKLLERAAQQLYGPAIFLQANLLARSHILDNNYELALKKYQTLTCLGYYRAYAYIGGLYKSTSRFTDAAVAFAKGSHYKDESCIKELESITRDFYWLYPWSRWEPIREIHNLLDWQVRSVMNTSFKVLYLRRGIPRDITLLILFYICTENGW